MTVYTEEQATSIVKTQKEFGDESAIEQIFEIWPALTRDEAVDVLESALRAEGKCIIADFRGER